MVRAAVLCVLVVAACGDDVSETAPPPESCADQPFGEGCPCLFGAMASCFVGEPESLGVGVCIPGRTRCVDGRWSACEGEIAPRGEICDTRDNDCDGLTDEGVRSPCGGCTPGCNGAVWGEADDPFVPSEGTRVMLGPLGELTLARETSLEATTIWIANSAEGTASKIDALRGAELARYATGGLEPSRVAVDYQGDAWIANRELDGGVSSVVEIAGRPDRCVDVDGDGLDTSTGGDDVLPLGEDDCVLLHVPVGTAGEVARAMAIDGDRGLDDGSGGNVWIGLHDGEAIVELDGLTGAELVRVPTPGFQPYMAAFDAWGTLWMGSRDGYLARVDRRADPPAVEIIEVPLPCFLLYSLAVDADGRLVLTGFSCDDVIVYDPVRRLFQQRASAPSPRGVAVIGDVAWAAHTGGMLSSIGVGDVVTEQTVSLGGLGVTPLESIGVGVDGTGQVWVASSQGGPGDLGVATRFDPETASVSAQVIVGRAPHTQGDLSGAELLGGFAEEGSLTHVFDGCPVGGETEYRRLHVELFAGATGTVEIAVRHAPDRASLASRPFDVVATLPEDPSPIPLSLPPGGVLEVRVVLRTSARDGAPLLSRIGVEWACPGPG